MQREERKECDVAVSQSREELLQNRKKWLPSLGERLCEIEKHIRELHKNKESFKQLQYYTPHGVRHYEAVEEIIYKLVPDESYKKLSENERFFLLASAWLHDIGMIRGIMDDNTHFHTDDYIRDNHHRRSEKYLSTYYSEVAVEEIESVAFGILARFHRRRELITECSETLSIPKHGVLRLRVLAAYLRLADALHIDHSRTPSEQYAITLTYDIPNKSKIHWLRHQFVSGIQIDNESKKIFIHLKADVEKQDDLKIESRLDTIYDLIIRDLVDELESVKNVLFQANISYFLNVEQKIHKVELNEQLRRDIRGILGYFHLTYNPSSSTLARVALRSIKGILDSELRCPEVSSEKSECEKNISSRIERFLEEINEKILGPRQCHTSLRNFIRAVCKKLKEEGVRGLRDFLNEEEMKMKNERRALWCSAYRYFLTKEEEKIQKIAENKESMYFNILLYGYSELVIKSLCGFRQAVMKKILKDYVEEFEKSKDSKNSNFAEGYQKYKDNKNEEELDWTNCSQFPKFHKNSLETQASEYFRIFICEGQPKNRTTWGGRIEYHDGSKYAETIAERGFKNIHIIPDAIASTLIMSNCKDIESEKCLNGIQIDYVIIGANGFDKEKFYHSAGHAMAVYNVYAARRIQELQKQESQKTEIQAPILVLTLLTNKYDEGSYNKEKLSQGICSEFGNEQDNQVKGGIVNINNWNFANPLKKEKVRQSPFFIQDPKLQKRLQNFPEICFYNPREDSIPINLVDVVLTEEAYIENCGNLDGEFIKTQKDDLNCEETQDDNNDIEPNGTGNGQQKSDSNQGNDSSTVENKTSITDVPDEKSGLDFDYLEDDY